MALNINSVVLAGTVEKIQVDTTSGGKTKATLRIKVVERIWDATYTTFFQATAWGKTAESMREVGISDAISISGRLQLKAFDDPRTGARREVADILINSFDHEIQAPVYGNPESRRTSRPGTDMPDEDNKVPF